MPPSQPTRYCALEIRTSCRPRLTRARTPSRPVQKPETRSRNAHPRSECFGDRLQQRLQRVLRDQLIGLERHRAIGAGGDVGLRLRDRRIRQMQQRRLDQRRDDEHVHGHVARKPGIADLLRDAEPPVDFHGAGVAPLHFWQELRRVLLLEQDAAHAPAAEIDGEREPDRPGTDNDDLRVQTTVPG